MDGFVAFLQLVVGAVLWGLLIYWLVGVLRGRHAPEPPPPRPSTPPARDRRAPQQEDDEAFTDGLIVGYYLHRTGQWPFGGDDTGGFDDMDDMDDDDPWDDGWDDSDGLW